MRHGIVGAAQIFSRQRADQRQYIRISGEKPRDAIQALAGVVEDSCGEGAIGR
jgi:hypothetical protein